MSGSQRSWAASRDFIMIHLDLLDAVEGSYPAAALWSRIYYRAGPDGWWSATRAQMAHETRLTEHQVRTGLQVLRDAGLVTAERVTAFDPTLRWCINWAGQDVRDTHLEGPLDAPGDPGPGGESPQHVMGDSSVTVMGDSSITSSKNSKNYSPPTPQGEQPDLFGASVPAWVTGDVHAPDPDPLAGFDDWYALYPRKVAKGDARKAWVQVTRAGADPSVIIDGVRRQAEDLRDAHVRGFCPYPASWLRGERWADADNVTPLRPSVPAPTETYDAAHAAALPPPPRKDLFG